MMVYLASRLIWTMIGLVFAFLFLIGYAVIKTFDAVNGALWRRHPLLPFALWGGLIAVSLALRVVPALVGARVWDILLYAFVFAGVAALIWAVLISRRNPDGR